MCEFILFLKNKIRTISELEYMFSVFTFVQYICKTYEAYIVKRCPQRACKKYRLMDDKGQSVFNWSIWRPVTSLFSQFLLQILS